MVLFWTASSHFSMYMYGELYGLVALQEFNRAYLGKIYLLSYLCLTPSSFSSLSIIPTIPTHRKESTETKADGMFEADNPARPDA